MSYRSWASVPIGMAVAVGVLVISPGDQATTNILAITLFCIALWIGNPVSPAVTGMVCIGLIGVVFSPAAALTGFSSPAFLLVFFGIMLGEAARQSGLANWGSHLIQSRALATISDGEDASALRAYRRLLATLSLAGIGLAFLIPSSLVRVLIVAPIAVEFGTRFESRRARLGLFLAPTLVTFYVSPGIFTAGLANIIVSGIAESQGAGSVSWSRWTGLLFPVMGLGRALAVTVVVYVLYRPDDTTTVSADAIEPNLSGRELRMLLFLIAGIAVWITDFIHGLHPMFGALLVVVLAVLPRVGVVEFREVTEVNVMILFFLGAVFAIGSTLSDTGFAVTATDVLTGFIPGDASLPFVLGSVFAITISLTFLLEGLAVASVLTPIIVTFAQSTGLPVEPIIMVEAVALGTYFFPYQAAPLIAVLGEDVADAGDIIRTITLASAVTILVLLPLQILVFMLVY